MTRRLRRRPPSRLELDMRRELGLAPIEQLELGLGVNATTGEREQRVRVAVSPCKACGRWNYHLVDCPEASS
jgi:hypothetical protein